MREREAAKAEFAKSDTHDVDTPAYRRAAAAVDAVGSKDDELTKAQGAQTGILRLLSQDPAARTTNAEGPGDLKAPGAWLAARSATRRKRPTTSGAPRISAASSSTGFTRPRRS